VFVRVQLFENNVTSFHFSNNFDNAGMVRVLGEITPNIGDRETSLSATLKPLNSISRKALKKNSNQTCILYDTDNPSPFNPLIITPYDKQPGHHTEGQKS